MKKILFIVSCLLTIVPVIQAKDKDEEVKIVLVKEENSDNYYYERIVPVTEVTKEEMYARAKEWVLSTLKTADNNGQFDQQNLSIINGGTLVIPPVKKTFLIIDRCLANFKIEIQFKEGKYRFRFTNFMVHLEQGLNVQTLAYSPQLTKYKNENKYIERELNKALTALTASLEQKIKGQGKASGDW